MHGPHFVYSSIAMRTCDWISSVWKDKNTQERRKKAGIPFLRAVGHSCICRSWWKYFLFCILQVYHFSATGLWCFVGGNRQALRAWCEVKKRWNFCLLLMNISQLVRPWRWGQNRVVWGRNKFLGLVVVYVVVVVVGRHRGKVPKREKRLISFFIASGVTIQRPVFTWRPKPELQLFLLWRAMASVISFHKPISFSWDQI